MNRIELHDVTVSYPAYRVPSLKEWTIRAITKGHQRDHFHALNDISLVIGEGESVGIIGPNGAGKSTLLRVAAGIITPSRGYAVSRGTMAPLIELGTGFDHELSGIENIYFNGALLGRSKAAMRGKLSEIVDFAGLGAFIDAPLRTYSTGMVGRLAFSIATAIDADIILLDEILSVGDASFQERCEERIKNFYGRGATVMLVSHDAKAIEELCERSIWIQNGTIQAMGPTAEVMASYAASIHHS